MNTRLVSKAEHALRTGQPRLATLYMRAAFNETFEGQAWLVWYDFHRPAEATGRHSRTFIEEPA